MIDERHPEDPVESEEEFLVEAIAEQFLERLRAGEAPDRRALASTLPRIGDLLEKHLSLIEHIYAARLFPMRERDQASRPRH
ncbi:MAG: hypothetical protein O7H41_17040 [Planctomycetota bacterium]|nr:hypothetical protein [Planctomycetota bacterium]